MLLVCVHPIKVIVVASLEQAKLLCTPQVLDLKHTKGLTFGEALEIAKVGYGIFREAWVASGYLRAKHYVALCSTTASGLAEFCQGEYVSRFHLSGADLLASDWAIYPEPLTKE